MMTKSTILFAIALCLTGTARAAEPSTPAASSTPNQEKREKMAAAHEKMAACLRSDKDLSVCHEELMKECGEQMGAMCSGMGMHRNNGMGMHRKLKK